jgi:hypothetical protein
LKKYEFNLIWVGVNDYIFFSHQWGTRSKSHMPTWFNKWETEERKLNNIKAPPHAHVLDPTQKKPKGVGILNRGLKNIYIGQSN